MAGVISRQFATLNISYDYSVLEIPQVAVSATEMLIHRNAAKLAALRIDAGRQVTRRVAGTRDLVSITQLSHVRCGHG